MKSPGTTADRLCGCSFIHPHQTVREGLLLAKSLNFSRVDIGVGGSNAHYDVMEVARSPDRFADELLGETESLQMQVNECFALNFGTPVNAREPEARKQTRKLFNALCLFATRACFQSVMLLAGPVHPGGSRQASRELAVTALRELVEIAGENGQELNIEVDSESCINTPEDALQVLEQVPGLGLTLDHSHFVCQGIAMERIELLYPFARHVHVRQSAPGLIVTPVEKGAVDFSNVVSRLRDHGYRGLYCIEYLTLTPTQSRTETEMQTRAMRQEMVRILRNNLDQ